MRLGFAEMSGDSRDFSLAIQGSVIAFKNEFASLAHNRSHSMASECNKLNYVFRF